MRYCVLEKLLRIMATFIILLAVLSGGCRFLWDDEPYVAKVDGEKLTLLNPSSAVTPGTKVS